MRLPRRPFLDLHQARRRFPRPDSEGSALKVPAKGPRRRVCGVLELGPSVDKSRKTSDCVAMRSRFVWRLIRHVGIAWVLAHVPVACQPHERSGAPAPGGARAAETNASTPSAAPSIDFDARNHDFGLVNEGDSIRHVFEVRNKGTAPLVMSGVNTSCGCTTASLGVTTIPAGGRGPLEVVMDTHGEHGEGRRSILVSSNDPHQPTSTLEIQYDVERLLRLDRSFVQLGARRGKGSVERVWLTGKLVEQARLRVVAVVGAGLVSARSIEGHEAGQPRKGVQLELRGRKAASGAGTVTIETGLPNPRELSLPFRYEVQ
jgi:hypothetical protein